MHGLYIGTRPLANEVAIGPGFIQASTRTWSLTCGATRIRVIEISAAKAGVREFAGHTGLRKAAVTPCSHVK